MLPRAIGQRDGNAQVPDLTELFFQILEFRGVFFSADDRKRVIESDFFAVEIIVIAVMCLIEFRPRSYSVWKKRLGLPMPQTA